MLKVGLTGGIGSGKSTVANLFAELDTPVIDTDIISRQLTQQQQVLDEIQHTFGADVIQPDGSLNRSLLATRVFADRQNKTILESILHPRIRAQMFEQLNELTETPYAIIVVPLLLETDFHKLVNKILVVDLTVEEQVRRVQQRDNRSAAEIQNIISHQIDRQNRLTQADDIIDNNGDLGALKQAVQILHQKYLPGE